MSRRPNPTPTPYTARDGTRTWRIRYRIDGTNTTETFDTKREAADFGADIRDFGPHEAIRRLTERDTPQTRGPSLDDVFEQFATWTARRVRSTRTVEDYRRDYTKAIKPTLGHVPIDQVTDDQVQQWVDDMTAGDVAARIIGARTQPLAPKTIGDRHALLSTIFGFASKSPRKYVTANPCSDTELPPKRKKPPVPIKPAEWAAIHAALWARNPPAADLALCLQSTGARFSEVISLTTLDVDDRSGDKLTLVISTVIRREAGSQLVRVQDTKSEAGFRRVKVDAACTDMVRRRLETAQPGDYLFTNSHGNRWNYATWRASDWVKACDKAGLNPRPLPHGLRHLHVADMLRSGATLPQIRTRLGHQNFSTTFNTYGALIEEVGDDVLDRMAARRDRPALEAGPVIAGELA